MGFLTPALLGLAAAAIVPLVLHLFQRHQGPRLVFPALRYLQRAEKDHARQIKLRQLLLLALRVGALALIAFAAARPFVRSGGAAHEPTAVAIVLDNSLSSGVVLGNRRVLDRLKERALETLGRAGPDDRFWLIRAGAPWEPAIPGDIASTVARVRETEVAAGAGDLGAAIERARTLIAAGAEGRATEIHLLSDLQATSFTAPVPTSQPAEGGARNASPPIFVWTPGDEPPPNAAVTTVQVGGGLAPRAEERSTVAAHLLGTGDADSMTVRLAVDGRMVAADVAPSGTAVALQFPARTAGLVSGWVEIDPDALRSDDRRYFVVRVQPPPTVALTRSLPFVEEALGVLADAGRIRRVPPDVADVVLAPAADGIEAFRDGRAVIVLPPTSPLELPGANRRLADARVPWRFSAPQGGGEARFDAVASNEAVDVPEAAAEAVGAGSELARTLNDVRLRDVYTLEPQAAAAPGSGTPADSVFLRLQDGRPWAIRGALGDGGRYVILATSFASEASTLPTSAAMLILLDRLLGPWATSEPARVAAVPGDIVPVPVDAEVVERPDGVRDPVESGGRYRIPGIPGIYQVRAGERVVDAFAVNAPASESRLDRLDGRRLRALLPGWELFGIDDAEDWAQTVFHRRLGSEMWRPLLLLALAVLLLEGLTAAAGPARARLKRDRPRGSPGAGAEKGARAVPRPAAVAAPGGGGVLVDPAPRADSPSPAERTA